MEDKIQKPELPNIDLNEEDKLVPEKINDEDIVINL